MREKSLSARPILAMFCADIDVDGTYQGGYRSTECSQIVLHTLLLHNCY